MAALAVTAIFAAGQAGVGKIKAQKEKRKARRQSVAEAESEADARENRFASSKAREASEERRRRIEEDEAEAEAERRLSGAESSSSAGAGATQLGTHPALRNPPAAEDEAPPPYVKDAPSYEEHYAHAVPEEPGPSTSPRRREKASAKPWRGRQEYREPGALIRDGQHINAYGNPVGTRPVSPPRPGETEEERKKRKRSEFFSLKNGNFWMLASASLAR